MTLFFTILFAVAACVAWLYGFGHLIGPYAGIAQACFYLFVALSIFCGFMALIRYIEERINS